MGTGMFNQFEMYWKHASILFLIMFIFFLQFYLVLQSYY